MSFLPIAERELRVAAQKRATFRARAVFAVLSSVLVAALVLFGQVQANRQTGATLFPILSTLAFLYCLLAGAVPPPMR